MTKKNNNETELPLASVDDWGFEGDDFANQGESSGSYFNRLRKFIRTSTDEFELVDSASNQVVAKYKTLEAVVCYHHTVAKLYNGLLTGSADGKEFAKWADDEKEVVAIAYDSPGRTAYPGMFAAFPEALKKKGAVKYRTWLWVYVPAANEYAVLTLGPSCLPSFNAWANAQKMKRRPNSATVTKIDLVKDKTETGSVFYRPKFTATDIPSAASKGEWQARFKDFADIAAAEHLEASKRIQVESHAKMSNGFAPMLGQAHAAPQIAAPVAPTAVDPADVF